MQCLNSYVPLPLDAQIREVLSMITYTHDYFLRVLSNTAPVYLEGVQRIYLSVDTIDGVSDIDFFVNEHSEFHTAPQPPQLEKHSFVRVSVE